MAKLQNSPKYGSLFSLETIFEKWQLFCEKPPKGFEKYFKPGGATTAAKDSAADAQGEPKPAAPSGTSASSKTPPLSKPPGADTQSKNDWSFGMFGQTASKGSGGSGSGRPIGGGEGNDREKWLLLGAIGIVGIIGTLAFMEINYKEIGWKEFVNK